MVPATGSHLKMRSNALVFWVRGRLGQYLRILRGGRCARSGIDSLPNMSTQTESTNPLLAEWRTPFGVPPFAEIEDGHFEPAFEAAMAEQKREIEAITASSEAPTFANTIEALERSGRTLTRIGKVFFGLNGAHSNDAIRALARIMAPKLTAHRDDILLDRGLFARVRSVDEQRETLAESLSVEQLKLLEETVKDFVRNGVDLDDASQARLREINAEIAELNQRFSQNLLAETRAFELHVAAREDLGTMPDSLAATAAEEARRQGHDSGWSFLPSRASALPFLRYSPDRELRRHMVEAFARRGSGGELDNREGLVRTATLRAERARLLGHASHADFVLSDNMAETAERVYQLLDQLWQPALAVARSEREELQAMMREDGIDDALRPWDWRYYAERVRRARYRFDEDALRPYFELAAVRDGAFMLAGRLFGLEVVRLEDVPTWHGDQQAFEVKDSEGAHVGLLYMDFFARESKRGGAWMNALRSQSKLDAEVAPIVTTTYNFPAPAAGSPCLLSFADAETLFHEFGHALHGLLSDVTYASLSGTHVPRDFVEFPSQVIENWVGEPEVLRLFARHRETGETIPDELIAKVKAAAKFGQGFATVEYLAACYLDMAWHTVGETPDLEPEAFERREMERIGLIDEILPRYRSPYFRHVFSGGYSAGYYSYIWSAVLDADGFEAFREAGLFDPETADRLRRLLRQGGSRHGMDLYREFRGRDPEIGPLLERRGLSTDPTS